MTLIEWTDSFKQDVQKIGLKVSAGPYPYQDKYLITVDWPDSSWGVTAETTVREKEGELRKMLEKHGITANSLSHLKFNVGRGKWWWSFYMGIRTNAIDTISKSKDEKKD